MPFIVFEGLDGSGKSTLLKRLAGHLSTQNIPHLLTREPGGTKLAEKIRELLLQKSDDAPVSRAEVLLYEASRAQHVESLILPALRRGEWVICDRFSASTVAFQCSGRGLPRVVIDVIDLFACQNLKPDLTVLLDVTVDQSASRKKSFELDRLESEARDFHERVREGYLSLARESHNWLVLNSGNLSPDELFQALLSELQRRAWLKS